MKIALCFWGLTRSLKYTNKSIQDKILKILKNANIEYKIFLHTYKFKSNYYNPRAKEVGLTLDFNDYKLLNADYIQLDDQDEVKKHLNMQKYRTNPDPWDTNYVSVDNFICAMYSKMQLGKMLENSGEQFDRVIFLRPDVKYLNNFEISFLSLVNHNTICIPNFHLYPDFNDRFCISNYKNALVYCNLFEKMLDYSKTMPLHSERFQSYFLKKIYNLNVKLIPFYFNRVRTNGLIELDYTAYNTPTSNILLNKMSFQSITSPKPKPPILPSKPNTNAKIVKPSFTINHYKKDYVKPFHKLNTMRL